MKLRLVQCVVSDDITENIGQITSVLHESQAGEWVIFPEGLLSGYAPAEATYIQHLNMSLIKEATTQIQQIVNQRDCYALIGSAWQENHQWFNSTLIFTPQHELEIYHKCNLATLDRQHFNAGQNLSVFTRGDITFGVQICREIAFPEQWRVLKQQGAKIIFHNNNAIRPYDARWKHVLITRALENQCFVCSVNNAESPQALASYIIDPSGEIIFESSLQQRQIASYDVDLTQVRETYDQQARTDLVRIATSNTTN